MGAVDCWARFGLVTVLGTMGCVASQPSPDAAPAIDVEVSLLTCDSPPEDFARVCGFRLFPFPTCSPDGEGWCCVLARPGCGCAPTGGFVTDPCGCDLHNTCDLPASAWGTTTDEHGCPTLVVMPTTDCCLCPPADAGPGDAGPPP